MIHKMKFTEAQKRIGIAIAILLAVVTAYLLLQYNSAGPCRKIRDLCEAQGFAPGRSPQQRRAFIDSCFRPLMNGETVGTVHITEEDAASCREFRRNRQVQRGEDGDDRGKQGRDFESDDEE